MITPQTTLCYKMTSQPFVIGWLTIIWYWTSPNAATLFFPENICRLCLRQIYVLVTTTPLPELIAIKNLGVTLTPDLSWSLRIANICKKTRKQIGLLYKNFYRFADSPILLKLYTSLVRPHTEYACAVWDPHLSKNILAIEGTHKFALRVCLKNWRANYDLLLNLAQLPQLSSRRKFLKLCLLFNLFTGKVAYHDSPLVRRLSPYPNRL